MRDGAKAYGEAIAEHHVVPKHWLDYIVVKGERNAGEYAGYHTRQFDITDRSAP